MRLVFDGFATSASERYVGLLNNFRNLLWNAMRQTPGDMRNREYLKRTALDQARTFRTSEEAMFEFSLNEVIGQVERIFLADTGIKADFKDIPVAVDYLDELRRFYSTELTSQIQRDIAQLERRLVDFSVEVFMNGQDGNPVQAHMNALIDTREQMKFFFKDRAGRKHTSQKFIRTTTRHTLLAAAVELYTIAASQVARHLEVTHAEGRSKAAGTQIGFRRDQGFPILADVREDIFHPNSDAFVKAVM